MITFFSISWRPLALRDCLRKRKAPPSDIFEMAKVDRIARVMRPYLEALA